MSMRISTLSIVAALLAVSNALPTQAAGPQVGWGYNKFGQINVPAGTFTSAAAGNYHSLAIRSDGTLVGWGYNGSGQINVPAGTFTAVAAGSDHSLAIRSDGTLVGWGSNSYGQTDVPSGTFTVVAAGGDHSLAIRSDGTLVGWGYNNAGQNNVPAGTFTAVAAGYSHGLAIRSDDTLVGWGSNGEGETNVPVGTFIAVAATFRHSLAIRSDGTLVGWGRNDDGQINVPAGTFTAVAAGGAHSLAIRSNGTLVGWGLNNVGQITVPSGTFMPVAAGYLHSLAIRFYAGCDIPPGTAPDCNLNGVPDECDIAAGTTPDCNLNAVPDGCDVATGTALDCNLNAIPDACDIAAGTAPDCNLNGVPDPCELAAGTTPDCNTNAVPDSCDIAAGNARDCNSNAVPDTCDLASGAAPDCNRNAVPDSCDIAAGTALDCNVNAVPDACDITVGTSRDINENGVPDECDQCDVIDLARLRAVPAWDIEFTRSTTAISSGSGGPLPSDPWITGFSINNQMSWIYSFRLTVAGDCTTQSSETWPPPCLPLLSPENPGELRVERDEIHDGWGINLIEAGCWCDTPAESTYSVRNDVTSSGGVLVLDGTPGKTANGGFGIDTSVCPPRAYAEISVFADFPARQLVTECRSCELGGRPAGCLTARDASLSGYPHGYTRVEFGAQFEEGSWLTDAPVRVENGRFVIRGQGVFTNPNSPCIYGPFYCGLGYDLISCSETTVSGARTMYFSVVIREHEAPAPPVAIHSVEFTQGIQVLQPLALLKADLAGDGSPPVPIVAGKPAVMRVYFDRVSEETGFFLDVSGGPITYSGGAVLDPACTPEDQRRQRNGCFSQDFYFTPPEGPWSVTLTLTPFFGGAPENHVLNLTSKLSDVLVLNAVSVCDAVDAAGNWHCASGSTLQTLVGLLKKIAPTDEVVVVDTGHQVKGRVIADMNGDTDSYDCFDDNGNGIADLGDRCEPDIWWFLVTRAIHNLSAANEPPGGVPGAKVLYYGMVDATVPAGVLGRTLGQARAIPSQGAASVTSANWLGGEANTFIVAHETAHMLGLKHTNTDQPPYGGPPFLGCRLGPDSTTDWPYSNNQIRSGSGLGVLEVGFDVQTQTALNPLRTFEVTGYCSATNWISPRSTLRMLAVLDPSLPGAAAGGGVAGVAGPYWQVSGVIEDGATAISPIFTINISGSADPGGGTHRIDVLDAVGNVLFTRFFTPIAPHITSDSDPPGQEGTPFFSELIPVQANAAGIEVRDPGGATLALVALGGTAPTVNITFPTGGELFQGPETASWTVTDPDSTIHMFQVHYSTDGGVTWRSLTSAESALSLVVDFGELPGSVGQSLLRVMASDGANTGTAVSNHFSVAKKQPSAKIISPSNEAGFASQTLVLLQAMGFDADEGLLTDAFLQWSSDVGGLLGSGDDLPVYSLSRGRHTITLTVTDGDGNTATDQVTVFVFDRPTADDDFDGDVDLVDFGRVNRCLAGPRTTPSAPACRVFDFNADGDVDTVDLAVFQNCVSGTDALADPGCAR